MQRLENVARLVAHPSHIEETETADLTAEKDRVGDGQVLGEVELLVDEHDTERFGLAIGWQSHRLAVEHHRARGRLFDAG